MQSTGQRGSRYPWWGDAPINIDEALLDFEEYGFLSPLSSTPTRTPQTPPRTLPSNPQIRELGLAGLPGIVRILQSNDTGQALEERVPVQDKAIVFFQRQVVGLTMIVTAYEALRHRFIVFYKRDNP